MKKLFFLFTVLISNICFSQGLDWEIVNTGSNHTLLLPLDEGVTLMSRDWWNILVGVYENDDGVLHVAGITIIPQISFSFSLEMMQFWRKDGFATEEYLVHKL